MIVLSLFLLQLSPAFARTSSSVSSNTSTDAAAVAAATAALADAGTLNPVEGTDANVIAMAQTIVNGVSSGVVVTVRSSSNTAVSKSGAITYSSLLIKGNVTFKLTKNRSAATQSMSVVVPAQDVTVTESTEVGAAQEALAEAGTLNPVEGTDTNVIAMAQTIVNGVSSGVVVTVYSSSNTAVSKSGAITYSSLLKTGNVTFELTKNSSTATQSMSVIVPAIVVIDPDATDVAAAKAALATAATLNPIEGTDTSVVTMAEAIVNKVSNGVGVTITSSANAQVGADGTITYGSSAVTGKVTFTLTKNQAVDTQSMSVVVPAEIVINPDATDVATAKAALTNATTFNPVEGTDTSVVTMAEAIVNKVSNGVGVTITSSANAQVGADGTITYGSSAVTGKVTFTLTKNQAIDTQSMSVVVPAKIVIVTNAYYVAVDGNDSNAGDILHPFKTIQKAAKLANAGYTVFIRGGTYNEKVIVGNSGTASAPITFSNFKGESVVIDGKGIDTSGSAIFNCNGMSYITVQGIKVINADAVGIGYSAGSSYITVKNCSTYNTVNGGIAFYDCSHITIIYNTVENASTGNSDEALFVEITSYFEIAYNQVLNSGREGIDVVDGSSHGTVHHNTVVGSSINNPAEGRCGLYIDGYSKAQTDIKVYSNIVHDCANGIFIACEAGGALDNVKVYDNLCYNNSEWGLALSINDATYGTISNVYYNNNITYDNGGSSGTAGGGIYLSDYGKKASNIVVVNNVFAEYRTGDLYVPICGKSCISNDPTNFTIDNNLSQKNTGWNNYAGSNAVIANPLFVDPADGNFALQSDSPAINIIG